MNIPDRSLYGRSLFSSAALNADVSALLEQKKIKKEKKRTNRRRYLIENLRVLVVLKRVCEGNMVRGKRQANRRWREVLDTYCLKSNAGEEHSSERGARRIQDRQQRKTKLFRSALHERDTTTAREGTVDRNRPCMEYWGW